MKPDIHPDTYRPVIFHDNTSGERFLIGSTVETTETDKFEDGKEYPLFRVEVSSASHPFYTGKQMLVDVTGRVDRFKKRLSEAGKTAPAKKSKSKKTTKKTKKDSVVKLG